MNNPPMVSQIYNSEAEVYSSRPQRNIFPPTNKISMNPATAGTEIIGRHHNISSHPTHLNEESGKLFRLERTQGIQVSRMHPDDEIGYGNYGYGGPMNQLPYDEDYYDDDFYGEEYEYNGGRRDPKWGRRRRGYHGNGWCAGLMACSNAVGLLLCCYTLCRCCNGGNGKI